MCGSLDPSQCRCVGSAAVVMLLPVLTQAGRSLTLRTEPWSHGWHPFPLGFTLVVFPCPLLSGLWYRRAKLLVSVVSLLFCVETGQLSHSDWDHLACPALKCGYQFPGYCISVRLLRYRIRNTFLLGNLNCQEIFSYQPGCSEPACWGVGRSKFCI